MTQPQITSICNNLLMDLFLTSSANFAALAWAESGAVGQEVRNIFDRTEKYLFALTQKYIFTLAKKLLVFRFSSIFVCLNLHTTNPTMLGPRVC